MDLCASSQLSTPLPAHFAAALQPFAELCLYSCRLFMQQQLFELPAASAALASNFGMGLPLLLQLPDLRGSAHRSVHWQRQRMQPASSRPAA